MLIDGEYLSRLGVGGGHSLLTTTASGTISLLCRLPKALVKEQIHEVWAGRPRYSQSAVYVVTLDVGSLRSKCLHLEQAVFHKMASGLRSRAFSAQELEAPKQDIPEQELHY